MAKLKDIRLESKVHGAITMRVNVSTAGVFATSEVVGKSFTGSSLNEVIDQAKKHLKNLDREVKIFPIIIINEQEPFGSHHAPNVCFEMRRVWISDTAWEAPNPFVEPEGEQSSWMTDRDIKKYGSVEALVRRELRESSYRDYPDAVYKQQFPVFESGHRGNGTNRTVYLAYTRSRWEAFYALQDKIRELKDGLYSLYGDPEKLLQLTQAWTGLSLKEKND